MRAWCRPGNDGKRCGRPALALLQHQLHPSCRTHRMPLPFMCVGGLRGGGGKAAAPHHVGLAQIGTAPGSMALVCNAFLTPRPPPIRAPRPVSFLVVAPPCAEAHQERRGRGVQGQEQDVPGSAAAALGQVGRRDPRPYGRRPQVGVGRPQVGADTPAPARGAHGPAVACTAPPHPTLAWGGAQCCSGRGCAVCGRGA